MLMVRIIGVVIVGLENQTRSAIRQRLAQDIILAEGVRITHIIRKRGLAKSSGVN